MHAAGVRDVERVPHGGADDPELLDFSANTNPETPPGTREVYTEALDAARGYPDDAYPAFRAAAADFVDCAPEQVVQTPGGLAGLRLALATRVGPGDTVLVPSPSFGEYAREVRLQGATPVSVPHESVVDADPTDHAAAILCRPNNPTGDAHRPGRVREFAARCRAAETELLVDEAFLGFTDHASLAGEEGVVVARALTKLFGLPGLRAGFLVATDERRDDLATARRAWNLSTPAARVGTHALRASEFVAATRERVRSERARLAAALDEPFDVYRPDAPGLEAVAAPFLLCRLPSGDVDGVVSGFRERGIAVRDARSFRGLERHVRVAVRTPEANDRLIEAARAVAASPTDRDE
ncbi:aminotransferase class I/II-fold pyridoxal phosphate-dependent enzyme [Halobaculum sp. MBLA0147]|uniref:aminotransferase class I/II-fold pyridoxal phosphate-dependent enzyme n=1 Tax=Halobaculum sp. MBLA0147 TaxID=3079934 RepID=UPI0035265337